jgi:hypothetical protein
MPLVRLALSKLLLKMNGMPSAGSDFLQRACRVHLQLLGLDDAGPGNQEERLVQPNVEIHTVSCDRLQIFASALWWSSAALMKALNSGWPSQGVDLNSG